MIQNGDLPRPLTIPSRALTVWRRLYQRYSLEPGPAGVGPDVSKTIVPITDADTLLRVPVIQTATVEPVVNTMTAILTVPTGQRWTVTAWDVVRVDGDRTLSAIGPIDPAGASMFLERFSGNTVATRLIEQPLTLDEGWGFAIRVEAATTDGDWTVWLMALVEDAF